MKCDIVREALSARLDGEREPVPSRRVDEHLSTCARCQDWYAGVQRESALLLELGAGRAATPLPVAGPSRRRRLPRVDWPRWALGLVGFVQVAVAVAQGAGASLGMPAGHGAMTSGHLLNESTAWSVALGAVMILAAVRPSAAAGLAGVLVVFTVVLAAYVVIDALAGHVTVARMLSHLPVVAGMILALWVWRTSGRTGSDPVAMTADRAITLPDNTSRGSHRSRRPGSAA